MMSGHKAKAAAGAAGRRAVYFAFQGLLMAVLLLIFVYQYHGLMHDWGGRFAILLGLTLFSLIALRTIPDDFLANWSFQAGLFIADAGLASLTLHWTQPQSDFYLIYFLIIFGTALARDMTQSLVVAAVTSVLYIASSWGRHAGMQQTTGFWLRLLFLWISASLLAILSRDTDRAQADQDRRYRERLIQFERLAALGQLSAEVAHRIKGPLTTILVNAEVLLHRHKDDKAISKELIEIRDEVERCKRILKNLLDLGRIEEMDEARIDLREPLKLALRAVEPQLRGRKLKKDVSGLGQPVFVQGDRSLLQEAFSAVLQNAVDASSEGGLIKVALSRTDRECRVLIADSGAGIEPAHLERIFQPFFTTKERDGTGLGLSAALRILQKHGGTIEAHSEGPSRGARFSLLIPRGRAAQP